MSIEKKDDRLLVVFNIAWALIAAGINYAVNFFITPYVTENVGVDAYGFVSLSTTLTSYVDIIAVALNAFVSRYISISYHKGDYKKANIYFNSVIISNIIFAIILIVPCGILITFIQSVLQVPDRLATDVKILFIVVLLNYSITIIGLAFSTATFIKNRLDKSEARKSISHLAKAGVLLVLCSFFAPHIWYIGLAYVAASIFVLFSNIGFTHKLTPELQFKPSLYSYKAVIELVSAGIWNSLNALGNVLNDGLDLLITNMMLSAESMGQVSIGKNLSTIYNLLLNTICNSFKPRQLRFYAQNDIDSLVSELRISMKYCGFITTLVFAGFVSCGKYFLQLWIPSQNIDVIFPITCICMAGNLIVGVVTPLYYVYTLTKSLKLPSMITIAMGFTNVAMMFILLKYTNSGVYSVVLTTALLNTCVHVIDAPIYSAICLKIKKTTFYPEIFRHLTSAIITTGVLCMFVSSVTEVDSWFGLILLGIPCVLIGSFIALITTFNLKEIKGIIKSFANKLVKK